MKKFENVEYEFTEIGYGQVLDIQDESMVIDASVDPPMKVLKSGKFTRDLVLAMFKKDGKPVNINDVNQCPIAHGAWLDTEVNSYISAFKAKNVQGGQEKAK